MAPGPVSVYMRSDILKRAAGLGLAVVLAGGALAACAGPAASSGVPSSGVPSSGVPSSGVPSSGVPSSGVEDTLARVRSEGVLRVGFANEAPFSYSDSTGKLTGFVTDVVGEVTSGIGIPKLEGVLTEFAGLVPGLEASRFDAVGAGLYITAARCQQATPSDPVYTVAEGIAVKKGDPKGLHSYQDAAKGGVKVGTVSGSVDVDYFKNAGIPQSQITLFPDVPSAIAGLEANRVDAVSMSVISLELQIKQANVQDLEVATPFAGPTDTNGKPIVDYGAVYFRKQDTALINTFNAQLGTIRDNGRLLAVMSPYGLSQAAVPPKGVTAVQLCQASPSPSPSPSP